MDIFNPLKGICRGVESDILNHLSHYPSYDHPSAIARSIGRSKSETIKCLHHLSDTGIITRSLGSGRAYALFEGNAVGQILLQFSDLPRRLASRLADIVAKREEEYLSITLAPESWGVVSGRTNLLIIAHGEKGQVNPYLYYDLLKTAREEFHLKLSIMSGTVQELLDQLRALGINTLRWPYCRSTKGARLVAGRDLIEVLGGTGGI